MPSPVRARRMGEGSELAVMRGSVRERRDGGEGGGQVGASPYLARPRLCMAVSKAEHVHICSPRAF